MKNSLSLLALVLFSVTGFSQVRWVTTLADDTIPGTLRYEIDHAPAQAQIRFVDSILPNGSDTLHLDSVIYITKAVDIRGYMRNGDTVFISGDSATQIFSIDMTTAGSGLRDLKLDSLAIIKGFSSIGGAIEMVHIEHTEITNCYFSHCSSIYGGGAIDCDRVGGNPWAFLIFSNNTFEENEGPSIVRIVDVQQIRVSDIVLKNNASARCFRIAANGKLIATRVYAFNNYEVNPFGANYAITIGADTLMTDSLFAFDNTECGGFSFGGQRQHHNHIYAINNTQPNGSGGIESVWYYSSGTPPTFENCVIKDNTGGLSGGMSMNAMVLKNSIVRNNTSTNFTGVGGIQFGSSTHVSSHIMNCSIDSNSAATGRGGGIYGQPKGLYISGSTIHSNSGATKGGGIYIWDADTLVIHNSFIGDNFGNEYGGVYARFDAYTEVKNSTIAYNVSNQGSGGLFNQGSLHVEGNLMIYNAMSNIGSQGTITSSGYNLIGDPLQSSWIHPTDIINPSFSYIPMGALADNGGVGLSRAPLPGNLAINLGNPQDTSLPFNRSIVGRRRDIGAVETNDSSLISISTISACDSVYIGGQWYSQTGYVIDTIPSQQNSDSVHITFISSVNQSFHKVDSISDCMPITWIDNVVYRASTSTPSVTYTAASGCDSTIQLFFTREYLDTTLIVSAQYIVTNEPSANVQWYYCDSNFTPVPNSSSQPFTPPSPGFYAAVLDVNGCIDTSECIQWPPVGLNEHENTGITVYPNPASESVLISSREGITQVEVISANGSTLLTKKTVDSEQTQINVQHLPKGLYILLISTENTIEAHRLTIQ